LLYLGVGCRSFRFIEDDKLDASDIREQKTFRPANDPRDSGIGPVVLQIANNGKRIAGVADR
jgi:hypothetical protein